MQKTQILIVEDEGIIAKDLQAMLRRLGYDVPVTVGTGEKAIATAIANQPDLILMDINLRGNIDGVDAATAITGQQDVPIVYLTANSDEATMQRAKITDPFGFLIKPFEERGLHAGIEMALYKHRSEKKNREREQWLSTTLRSIGDGVITTDANGLITFVNAVAEKLLGRTYAESVGRHYSGIFSILDEMSRLTPIDAVALALTEGRSHYHANHTLLISKQGAEKHIEHSTAPIREDDAPIAGCVIVFSDVSEREKLEAELRQIQKMDAVGKLAGSIAHDFNNALTAMMGYSSLMMARIPAQDSLHEDASHILRAAEHSARLTRQLLVFSRKQIMHPMRMDLGETVRHVHGLLRRMIRENIALSVSVPDDLWPISADPGQCEQIVINLAVNARDAMPEGGNLSIGLGNVSLSETCEGSGREYVALQISDTGIGMSREVVDRIFEPFFTTKPADRGTGLGLSTCERIVKQAGGFIHVSSTVGKGTVFTIYFPRTDLPAPAAETTVEMDDRVQGASGTILVVEDEEAVRMLAARVLEEIGYTVFEAESGVDALKLLTERGSSVDLIITDLVMPGMSGQELIERLQSMDAAPCVLFISGYTDDDIIGDASSEAEIAFLQKPFTPDALARKARETIAKAQKALLVEM